MTAPADCRVCQATELGCEHAQLSRGRRCCSHCHHQGPVDLATDQAKGAP